MLLQASIHHASDIPHGALRHLWPTVAAGVHDLFCCCCSELAMIRCLAGITAAPSWGRLTHNSLTSRGVSGWPLTALNATPCVCMCLFTCTPPYAAGSGVKWCVVVDSLHVIIPVLCWNAIVQPLPGSSSLWCATHPTCAGSCAHCWLHRGFLLPFLWVCPHNTISASVSESVPRVRGSSPGQIPVD